MKVAAIASASAVLIALAGIARGQTVEFRIVERNAANQGLINAAPPATGTPLTSANPVGNYAVQARVTAGPAGAALGGFSFDIVIPGEPDTNGTLARLRITVFGFYYTGGALPDSSIGGSGRWGGLAAQFSYLASIGGFFGNINTTWGTFTNNPAQQEIGLVLGSATGSALLSTPDIDPSGENNIGTWSGYGVGAFPPNGATASLDPTIGATYFAEGQFIDLYRFRYTVSDFSSRAFTITLANAAAQVFNQFLYNNSAWGPQATTVDAGSVSVAGLQVEVSPNPGSCCGGDGGCEVVSMLACPGGSMWTLGGTCTPNTCPPAGACCASTGECTLIVQSGCADVWMDGGVCSPNPCPQPGVCCALSGSCSLSLQTACATGSQWNIGGSCTPNPCFGSCCAPDGTCQFVPPADCAAGSIWTQGGSCSPTPCPQPGACCRGAVCQVLVSFACTGPNTRFAGAGNACNVPGNAQTPCCAADFNQSGSVTVADIMDFINAWLAGSPWTDVNGFGGADVADIFEFLTAWFAGCS